MIQQIRYVLYAVVFTVLFTPTAVHAQNADGTEGAGELALSHAYPNPFADQTTFELSVDEAQAVRVEVFDVLGRRVETLFEGSVEPGTQHAFVFDGEGLAPGLYLYRVTGETISRTRRVMRVP